MSTRPWRAWQLLLAGFGLALVLVGAIGSVSPPAAPRALGYVTRQMAIRREVNRFRAAGWAERLGIDDAQLNCLASRSEAQDLEDVVLLPLLINAAMHHGATTFVELGAFDGKTFSNSYMLEACFGWHGLLIEGNPANFARTKANRPSPHNRVINMAVCNQAGPGYVNFSAAASAMSGDESAMSESFKRQHHREKRVREQVRVPCSPLSAMMADAGLRTGAAFLSLDVEGAEAKVLETVDPSVFEVVLVELDGHDTAKDLVVHQRLIGAGLLPPFASMGRAPGDGAPTKFAVPRSGVYVNARNGFLAEYVRAERAVHAHRG